MISVSVAGQLPNVLVLKRTGQLVRRTHLEAPMNPQHFNIEIPDRYAKTTDGELLFQFDNGSKRKIVFYYSVQNGTSNLWTTVNIDFATEHSHVPFKYFNNFILFALFIVRMLFLLCIFY